MAWASCYTPDFRVVSIVGAAAGTTATNDRRLVETDTELAALTFVVDSIDTGRYALRTGLGNTSQVGLAIMTTSSRYAGAMMRFKNPLSGWITNLEILKLAASTATDSIVIRILSVTGALQYSFNNASTFTTTSTIINPGQVYRLEVFVDWNTGTTHTLKVRLDGAEVINTTGGAAIATAGNQPLFGANASSASSQIDMADLVTYNDVAQYATMDNWRVYGVEPTSDGAHSMTANDFQDDAATNLSNSTTTSWSKVDDAPSATPTVTDFVQQVVLRATSYMEWVLNTTTIPANAGTPVLVCLAAAMHPVASANANSVAFRLNSGGNLSTEAAIDTSVASNTLEYRKHHYPTEPSTAAAWTIAKANALRARFGYSGDATPPPALDSIMAFVVAPIQKSLVVPPRQSMLHRLTR